MTGVFGLKFRDGPHHRPLIEASTPTRPPLKAGLRVGMEINEINGVK